MSNFLNNARKILSYLTSLDTRSVYIPTNILLYFDDHCIVLLLVIHRLHFTCYHREINSLWRRSSTVVNKYQFVDNDDQSFFSLLFSGFINYLFIVRHFYHLFCLFFITFPSSCIWILIQDINFPLHQIIFFKRRDFISVLNNK